MDISERVAVVTGGGAGIGRVVAQVLAGAGASGIIVADIDEEGSEETVSLVESGSEARGLSVKTDVSDEDQVNKMVEAAVEQFGKVDILVNNAGICPMVPWDETTLESWDQIMSINLTGAYLCSKAVLPHMRKHRYGRIAYISSVGAFIGSVTGHVAYGASKAGIIALMKVVAKKFASEGILANAVAPGSIDTPLTDSFGPEAKRNFAEASPLKRQGTARELADAVLYLVSDRSSYVTGTTFHVNGGSLLV